MSVTYDYLKYKYKRYQLLTPGNVSTAKFLGETENTLVMDKLDKTDTVYRTMPTPKALWASGTARLHDRTVLETTYGNRITNNRDYLDVGVACRDHYSLVDPVLRTVFPNRDHMYNQIRKDLRGKSVNLAMCIAEYQKTALLFRDAAKLLTMDTGSLLRGAAGTAKSSKEISRRWLQYQYGVKPLAKDVLTLIELMKGPRVDNLYLSGRVKRPFADRVVGIARPNSTVHTFPAHCELIRNGCYYTAYRAKFSGSRIRNTLITSGFANPFNLAWELIPFSFVVDWWIGIGDALASLDNLLLFDSLQIRDSWRDSVGTYVTSDGGNMIGHWTELRIRSSRQAPTTIPLVSSFAWKPSVSYQHIANGTALLRMQMRR